MTLAVVWLLQIPGLMLAGGLGLVWIAYKLLADQGEADGDHGPAARYFALAFPVPNHALLRTDLRIDGTDLGVERGHAGGELRTLQGFFLMRGFLL